MKFRSKLILFFVLLITIPSIINIMINYKTSSEIIISNAKDGILEVVQKKNEISDLMLRQIEERTIALISDPDLYRLFDREQPQDDYELLKMDREASALLSKYFRKEQDLYIPQLVTSYYSFGLGNTGYTSSSPFISVPSGGFTGSYIHERIVESQGSLVWIPTYDMTRVFNQPELSGMDAKLRMIFSIGRVINSSPIIDGMSRTWPAHVERPVLLINFHEEYYRQNGEQADAAAGSYFYVVSKEGQIVTHPDSSQLGHSDKNGWYREFRQPSGTSIVKDGQEDVLMGYAVSEVTGWVTVYAVPYQQLLRNLPLVRYTDLLTALALILLSIGISYVISDRLTKPIKRMMAAIQLTGAGDFSTKIPDQSQLEFRILIKKYNQMNEKIVELLQENYESTRREKEAEMLALNLQLNPHFLYNTLNIINWMAIERDERAISRMIVSLSTMLQYTVNNGQEKVSLGDDLLWLQSYTHIMENRYAGVFEVKYELEELPLDTVVPKLFLQPIVENAIIHSMAAVTKEGMITISGRMCGQRLCFSVADNGKGMSREQLEALLAQDYDGIGIRNIRKRLALMYGTEASLQLESEEERGTVVTVTIPLSAGLET
ncbi:sensor histidine kinase [Paenibacillus albidus]|nr:histidine kinase [Paenibacillus albidus]